VIQAVQEFQGGKLEQFLALNVAIAIATVFRFWSYRKWVWAAPADGTPVPAMEVVPPGAGTPPAALGQPEQLVPGFGRASGNGHVRVLGNGNGDGGHAAANGHDPHAANRR